MDHQQFDTLAKALARSRSRREVLVTLAGSAGSGLLALFGVSSLSARERRPRIVGKIRVEFDGQTPVVTWTTDQPTEGVVEYGTSAKLGERAESEAVGTDHVVRLPALEAGQTYYFQVTSTNDNGSARSKRGRFTVPGCPEGTVPCRDTCVTACPDGWVLDGNSCNCVCANGQQACGDACFDLTSDPNNCGDCGVICELDHATAICVAGACAVGECEPGYGDCDGDPSNGCETPLDTVDNCLACGNKCDDGNACTEDICDPVEGCVSTSVPDGTPCGMGGTCQGGQCADCAPGGTCEIDKDCCDDEVCCGGTCVSRDSLASDPNNCGACGNVCESEACADGVCVDESDESHQSHRSGVLFEDDFETGDLSRWTSAEGLAVQADDVATGAYAVRAAASGSPAFARKELDGEQTDVTYQLRFKQVSQESEEVSLLQLLTADGSPVLAVVVGPDGKLGTLNEVAGQTTWSETTATAGEWHTLELRVRIGEDGSEVEVRLDGDRVADLSGATNLGADPISEVQLGDRERRTFELIFDDVTVCAGVCPAMEDTPTAELAAAATSAVVRLVLVNADTDEEIGTLEDGAVLDFSKLPTKNLNVVALTSPEKVGSVRFGLDNKPTFRIENTAPYALAGDRSGDFHPWTPSEGAHTLTATCYSGPNATGQAGTPLTVRFTVGQVVEEPTSGGTSTVPGANQRVLLASYAINADGGVNWSKVVYRPRQFNKGLVIDDPTRGAQKVDNPGAYVGWDILPTYNYSVHRAQTRSDWFEVELNRPATLALVWRGGSTVPKWIQAWTKAGDVVVNGKTLPTYRKTFGAGTVKLGGVFDPTDRPGNHVTRDTYWILLAEQDGKASPAPAVPSGREVPRPNETCPSWVHDQYVTTGPDGKTYATWHPLIDPVYWCYHRHEHGSNPEHFAPNKKPPFHYVASKHGMEEPHAGFKNIIFDSQDGTRWMITQHFGTGGLARACNRFHSIDIAVRSIATGELLVDVHLAGDFGKSQVNRTLENLTPPACPDQAAQAAGSTGSRQIPTQSVGIVEYEPWRVDLKKTILGFEGDFTINNPDGMVICNTPRCDQPVVTGKSGSKRFFTANKSVQNGKHFGIVAGPNNSGEFYTDPMATKRLNPGDPHAVRQYIKPGVVVRAITGGHCWDVHAWGRPFVCGASGATPTDREGSIQIPN